MSDSISAIIVDGIPDSVDRLMAVGHERRHSATHVGYEEDCAGCRIAGLQDCSLGHANAGLIVSTVALLNLELKEGLFIAGGFHTR